MSITKTMTQAVRTTQTTMRKTQMDKAAHDRAKVALEKNMAKNTAAREVYEKFTNTAQYKALPFEAKTHLLQMARNLGPRRETFVHLSNLALSKNYGKLNSLERTVVEKTVMKNKARLGEVTEAYKEILDDRPFAHARIATRMRVLQKPERYAKLTMKALLRTEAAWVPEKREFNAWGKKWVDAHAENLPPKHAALLFNMSDAEKIIYRRKVWSKVLRKVSHHRDRVMSKWYEKAENGKNETVGEAYSRVAGRAGGLWQDTLLRLNALEGESHRRWLGVSWEDREPKFAY